MPGAHTFAVHERDAVTSTQDEARALLRAGALPPLAVRARVQSAGRGRRGRGWESPEGGLWLSVVLGVPPPADPILGLIAALAALEAVGSCVSTRDAARLRLKWPNDLVIEGDGADGAGGAVGERKWGGVLGELETSPLSSAGAPGLRLLLGLGLDLAVPAAELPRVEPPALPATSILAEFGRSPSPEEVLPLILSRLEARLALDRAPGGRARTVAAVAAATSTLGQPIQWQEGGRTRTGRALALAPDGGLEVEADPPAGTLPESAGRRVLRGGEIEVLRARG